MLRALDPAPPASTTLVDFSSNDYISFGQSPKLRKKLADAIEAPATSLYGPPSSRLLDGNSPLHASLEHRLAAFFQGPSALLFNSGFDANAGLWACLPGPDDWIVYDELVHASIHDGMRASRVPKERRRAFKHNSLRVLETTLQSIIEQDEGVRLGERSVWVGVETLYSMDGDLAPLREMAELVERVLPAGNGHLVVDEAHSTGLYGPSGRGLTCALGLANRVTVRVHTFGKAMACSGAVVLASPLIRDYLINYARPLIYSTAMTYMSALAIQKSLEMLEEGESEPSRMSTAPPSTSPIIPLLTSSPRPLAGFLRERGFLVRPITYPTVPRGEERVRICLHAGNTQEEVEGLCEAVKEWIKREERAVSGSSGQSRAPFPAEPVLAKL
ncbi:hypothetical protein Rhopal_006743-T1 [Rhodotorula paludigena]|uniref:Aminotransferase class I/classII large domain-containing protein n=1 Tax=Rhodotorula paludigena TaxID=86838 RepID=A0AAV5GW10_9BASI|nr:hypothetical protein Rhopal_006743-T1 [Rhodotorula paludigena]